MNICGSAKPSALSTVMRISRALNCGLVLVGWPWPGAPTRARFSKVGERRGCSARGERNGLLLPMNADNRVAAGGPAAISCGLSGSLCDAEDPGLGGESAEPGLRGEDEAGVAGRDLCECGDSGEDRLWREPGRDLGVVARLGEPERGAATARLAAVSPTESDGCRKGEAARLELGILTDLLC